MLHIPLYIYIYYSCDLHRNGDGARPSKLKIDYRLFDGILLVDRLSFFKVYQQLSRLS